MKKKSTYVSVACVCSAYSIQIFLLKTTKISITSNNCRSLKIVAEKKVEN